MSSWAFSKIKHKHYPDIEDLAEARQQLANDLEMIIEIYDDCYWTKTHTGEKEKVRYLPKDQILLLDEKDYNNKYAYYFANGVVIESIMDSGFQNSMFGPIAYFEPDWIKDEEGNAKQVISAYALMRGFPVRYRETCSAIITLKED